MADIRDTEQELIRIENTLKNILGDLKITSRDLVDSFDLTSAKKEVNSLLMSVTGLRNNLKQGFIDDTSLVTELSKINDKFLEIKNTASGIMKEAAINAKGTFLEIDNLGNKTSDKIDNLISKYTELKNIAEILPLQSKTYTDTVDGKEVIKTRGSIPERLPENMRIIAELYPKLTEVMERTVEGYHRLAGLKGTFTRSGLEERIDVVNQSYTGGDSIEKIKQRIVDLKTELQSKISGYNFIDSYDEAVKKLEADLEKDYNTLNAHQSLFFTDTNEKINQLQQLLNKPIKFNGFIQMYNELNTILKNYEQYSEAIDTAVGSAQFNSNNIPQFKADVDEVFKQNKIEEPSTRIVAAKEENEILNEIAKNKEKIEQLNKQYDNTNLTNEYLTEEKIAERENNRLHLLEEIKKLQNNVSNFNIIQTPGDEDLTELDISYYNKQINDAISNGNKLRENIAQIQNAVNNGQIFDSNKLLSNEQQVKDLVNLLQQPHRASLVNQEDIQRVELLEDLVRKVIEDIGKINTNAHSGNSIDILENQRRFIGAVEYKKEFQATKGVEYNNLVKQIEQYKYEYNRLNSLVEKIPKSFSDSNTELIERARNDIKNLLNLSSNKLEELKKQYNRLNISEPIVGSVGIKPGFAKVETIERQLGKKIIKPYEGIEEKYRKVETRILKLEQERNQLANQMAQGKYNSIMSHVQNQEIMTGQKMPLQEQLEFYKQALPQFEEYSQEYLNILKRIREIEQSQAKESVAAERARSDAELAEVNKRIQAEEAQERELAKQKQETSAAYNTILSTVRSFAAGVENTMKRLLSIIRTAINGIVRIIQSGFRVFQTLGNAIRRLFQLFGSLSDRVRSVSKDGNILKGTFTELKSKIDLLTSAFNKLFNNQFIEKGKKLLQSIQTLNITLGKDLTDNTIRWAKELERAFGVSASGLISDLQGLNAVLYGMGMNSKETELAGRNLLAIGQTLVGITGYDFNTVMTKLESGMKGMTQSIDDLGLSVRETQMDQFLKDLKKRGGEFSNIETSFQKLNEQQRIYVRYAALVNQFTSRFSAKDYIKSLDSITGRLTVLNARIDSLKTTLGNLILQIVDRITVPLAILVATIEKKIIQLAKLFGIDLQISSGMNKTAAGAAKAANSLGDVDNKLKDIENTADKAKGSLDAFDHITTISSSNGSGSGSPFDYSNLLTAVPDFAKQLEDLAKLQDDWLEQQKNKILAKLKELGETIKNKISAWWKNLTGRIIDWNGITNKLKLILTSLKQVGANIKKIFKGAFDIVAGLIGMILDDLNALTLLDSFSRLLASITGFIATFFEKIKEPLFKFYNTYLKKYVEEIGKWLNSKLLSLINKFDMLKAWWSDDANKPKIEAWFDEAGKKVDSFVDKVKKAFTVLKVVVFGLSIDDAQAGKYEGIDPKILDTANNLHTIFSEIAGIVSDLLRDLGQFMVTDGLKQVAEHIERISKMLSENHEGYVKVIEGCANAINKIKEAVLTKIESILDWIGKNPELVVTMLDKVSDILSGLIKHIEVIVGLIGVAKITLWVTGIITAISTVKKLSAALQVLSGAAATANAAGAATAAGAGGAATAAGAGGAAAGGGILGGAKIPSIGSMLPGAVQTAAGWVLPITVGLTVGVEGIRKNWSELTNVAKQETTSIREDAKKTIDYIQNNFGQVTTSMLDAAQENYKNLLVENNNITTQQAEEYSRIYRELMEQATRDFFGNKQIVDDSKEIEQATNKINEGNKKVSSSIDGMSNSANKASGSLATTADNINILSTTEAESKQTTQDFISLLDEARTTGVKAGSQINNRFSMLSMSLQRSKTNGEELCDVLDKLAERADKINSISLSMNAVKNSTTGVTKAKGYASGGVPKKGSIFFANENGNLELTGNFGGYNGVANQNMIIQSMQRAIASGMYDAINEAMSNNNNNTGVTNIEICKQGMFVGDDNAVRKLANKLNNALISSNGNIANKAFSLG